MTFTIRCGTFARLAHAANQFYNASPHRPSLNCVRLERRSETVLAIATNSRILAVERIGTNDKQPDGEVCVALDPVMLDYANANQDDLFFIAPVPGVPWATVKSMMGWSFAGNAMHVWDGPDYPNWRAHIPSILPENSRGFVYLYSELIKDLGRSSPSGHLALPFVVDSRRPTMVRDGSNSDWFGVFIPSPDDVPTLRAAEIPEWL